MSMPRRAMEQMGFSISCLTCDAPDVTGSSRCRSCIKAHESKGQDVRSGYLEGRQAVQGAGDDVGIPC